MKTIEVLGTIVPSEDQRYYDYWGIESTSPAKIKKALMEAAGDDVLLCVNSPGGDVWSANEIYYVLSSYAGAVTADIMGIAASAATIVCCGADKVRMAPGAQYMIHNASTIAWGDHNEMDKTSGILQSADKAISNVYRRKTGRGSKELLKLMDSETWMDADKAILYGFVDELIGDKEQETLTPDSFTIKNAVPKCVTLTEEQIAEAKKALQAGDDGNRERIRLMQNQLTLLKLKGGIKDV